MAKLEDFISTAHRKDRFPVTSYGTGGFEVVVVGSDEVFPGERKVEVQTSQGKKLWGPLIVKLGGEGLSEKRIFSVIENPAA